MKKTLFQLLFFAFILMNFQAFSQLPAVVKDWALFAGNQDSTFKTPVVSDSDYTYVATYTIDSVTGADILIIKYDSHGNTIWTRTWTGGGA